MKVLLLSAPFPYCKLRALPGAAPLFFARTDKELPLLCPTAALPKENLLCRDDGWRALRVAGPLDFSLMGILSRLTGVSAQAGVPLSAVSTCDTDYLFVKEAQLPAVLFALRQAGETVEAEWAAGTICAPKAEQRVPKMQKDPDWQATPIRAFLEPHTYTHFGERTRFGISPR